MDNEDNEFFILVLGVLAAIIVVVSWWYVSGGTATAPVAPVAAPAPTVEVEASDEPAEDAAPAPTAVAEATAVPAPAAPAAPESLLNVMLGDPNLSSVTGLLRDEGLDATLALTDAAPLTVFAPSNDAVGQAAESATTVELLETDRGGVLTYHVVPGSYSVEQLVEIAGGPQPAQLETLQGEPVSLTLDDAGSLVINGNTVLTADAQEIDAGVVHTLSNVLVPPVTALNTIVGSEPILFATGSATIQQESFETLDQLIAVLSGNSIGIDVEGHTDSSGDPVLNQNLSESRARSVVNYLVANGIEESRLSATGFGPDQPVADNDTEEGRSLNRRIEFSLN